MTTKTKARKSIYFSEHDKNRGASKAEVKMGIKPSSKTFYQTRLTELNVIRGMRPLTKSEQRDYELITGIK